MNKNSFSTKKKNIFFFKWENKRRRDRESWNGKYIFYVSFLFIKHATTKVEIIFMYLFYGLFEIILAKLSFKITILCMILMNFAFFWVIANFGENKSTNKLRNYYYTYLFSFSCDIKEAFFKVVLIFFFQNELCLDPICLELFSLLCFFFILIDFKPSVQNT